MSTVSVARNSRDLTSLRAKPSPHIFHCSFCNKNYFLKKYTSKTFEDVNISVSE